MFRTGLAFEPVLDYEQVLVFGPQHPLRHAAFVLPRQLAEETLISYPVAIDRLDVYTQFLLPAAIRPKRHKPIETADIMLQMVPSGRGVAALPCWLVEEYAAKLELAVVRLGAEDIAKQIFVGIRRGEAGIDYLQAFLELARSHRHRTG